MLISWFGAKNTMGAWMRYSVLGQRGRMYPGSDELSRVFRRSVSVLSGPAGSQSSRENRVFSSLHGNCLYETQHSDVRDPQGNVPDEQFVLTDMLSVEQRRPAVLHHGGRRQAWHGRERRREIYEVRVGTVVAGWPSVALQMADCRRGPAAEAEGRGVGTRTQAVIVAN